MKERLKEFYVVQVQTDKIKTHIVDLEVGERIYNQRKLDDTGETKIDIRNGSIKSKYIISVFKSYDHKTSIS